jgi:hypothetical protein
MNNVPSLAVDAQPGVGSRKNNIQDLSIMR